MGAEFNLANAFALLLHHLNYFTERHLQRLSRALIKSVHNDTKTFKHVFNITCLCAGNSLITSEFSSYRANNMEFHDFFVVSVNNFSNKQSRGQWIALKLMCCHCNALKSDKWQAFTWTNDDPVHWHIGVTETQLVNERIPKIFIFCIWPFCRKYVCQYHFHTDYKIHGCFWIAFCWFWFASFLLRVSALFL